MQLIARMGIILHSNPFDIKRRILRVDQDKLKCGNYRANNNYNKKERDTNTQATRRTLPLLLVTEVRVSIAFGYNSILGRWNAVDLVFRDLNDVGAGAESRLIIRLG